MRIRKLELFGFKSFPDRTTFEFGPGISCVVGPNGSGKSNVVDALRWCIGEQSAKSLRGAEMSDVIFAGSSARSPVGFAEVTLTLASDGGEPFPGDFARFEELEVGRRLYRDGTSEYLVNRVKCRRRDIVDLFLDTGVGSNLYSFIAQGQVDRIVSQSAVERRSLIDEAAGITRYKARREEAMSRLTATAAQLDRAADVSDEMSRRIRALEKQVLKAGRFRRARAKIRQREIALGVVKYGALAEDRRALRDRLRHAKDEAGALKRSVDRLTTELETRSDEVQSVRDALQQWREEAGEQEAQRREAEGARKLQLDRHRELLEAVDRARARVERANADAGAAREEQSAVESELATLRQGGGDAAIDAARAERERAAAALAAERTRVQGLRDAEARRLERSRTLAEEAERLRLRLAGLSSEPVAETEPLEATDGADLEVRVEEARSAAASARGELAAKREHLRAAEGEAAAVARAYEAELQSWERDRSAREARRADLRRWYAARSREMEIARGRERTARVDAARDRAGRWLGALRSDHARRLEAAEAREREASEQLRRAHVAAASGLREEEAAAVASAEAGLDLGGVERAREASEKARAAASDAERSRREAGDAAAGATGSLRALEAELAELDARRAAVIPAEWEGRAPLADVATADDPRRAARPELLGLPVVAIDDLGGQSGRGVLAGVQASWRVVDTLEQAIAVLAQHGPPVVSRDGRLRVDPDGLVELGERPGDRWAEVRDAVGAARESAALAEQSRLASIEAEAAARAAADEARQRLESEEAALRTAREAALAAVRERFAARAQALEAARSEAEASRAAERDAHLASLRTALRTELEAAEAQREAGLGAISDPPDLRAFLRAAAGRAWPHDAGPRPTRAAPSDLGPPREAVRAAELAVERADGAVAEALRALEAHREARRAEERAMAERDAARKARLAESTRIRTRLLEVEAELERSEPDAALAVAEAQLESAERALAAADGSWREVEARSAARRERITAAEAHLSRVLQTIETARAAVLEAEEEIARSTAAASEALAAAETAEATAAELAVQRGETLTRVERERSRLEKLDAEHTRVRESLDDARERSVRAETEQVELDQRVQTLQLEIEGLRKRLGDRYQVSLPGLLDRLWMRKRLVVEPDEGVQDRLVVREVELEAVEPLSIGIAFADDAQAITAMVAEVEAMRAELQALGEVNLAAEDEYRDLDGRYQELLAQTEDLEASVKSIRAAIAKMNRTCRERFRDAYDRVNEAFQLSYPQLVGGGDARLALTDEEDLLETGVDIFVRPPGKRLQNLTLLSGGEKAMTAIALLLALFQVKPSPFCVLDEVDAPLDEANGARFNDMVREMSQVSQFIVITHNRKTMECADVLYGVTMAHPGVSTLVSVALDA
ncbi:MAG: AAA family ATPase [Alphaproteobacteria bacterium]|nr:AAA family ATPase [Alphaproteobacteria bacterium]